MMGRIGGGKGGVLVELSEEQVREVVRASVRAGGLLGKVELGLSHEALLGAASGLPLGAVEGSAISHALVRGLRVLAAFPADGGGRGVAEVAEELGMTKSTAHRYISTLVAVGLIVQQSGSRQYRRVGG